MPFPASAPATPSSTSSKYKLKADAPTGFNEERKKKTLVHLRRRVVRTNVFEFDYRMGFAPFEQSGELEQMVNNQPWIPFFRGTEASGSRHRADDEHLAPLDIHIYRLDAVVEMVTFDDLFWSRRQHAIQTKISREDFYGYLRYTDNGEDWDYFDEYIVNHDSCQRVSFKAKLNDDYQNRNHKFSFFVLFEGSNGRPLEYEIDPDIKNPST